MRSLPTLVVVVALALTGEAGADKPDKPDKGKHEDREGGADVRVVFTRDQRERAQGFFVETYGRSKCPPGLAKKGRGCLPPGQARKRYVVGRPLSREITVQPLPGELSVRIGVAPAGYRYGIVDGDLVKLVVGTMIVVDAIEGLVN
jgi:hypothetical protein